VLRVKLQHLEDWTRARQRKAQQYESMFIDAGIREHVTTPYSRGDGRHVFHLFVIRVSADRRDELREYLSTRGVGNGVYYPVPLHLQKCFAYLGYKTGDLPLTEAAAAETVALPMYPELTDAQQDYVVGTVAEFFR